MFVFHISTMYSYICLVEMVPILIILLHVDALVILTSHYVLLSLRTCSTNAGNSTGLGSCGVMENTEISFEDT